MDVMKNLEIWWELNTPIPVSFFSQPELPGHWDRVILFAIFYAQFTLVALQNKKTSFDQSAKMGRRQQGHRKWQKTEMSSDVNCLHKVNEEFVFFSEANGTSSASQLRRNRSFMHKKD